MSYEPPGDEPGPTGSSPPVAPPSEAEEASEIWSPSAVIAALLGNDGDEDPLAPDDPVASEDPPAPAPGPAVDLWGALAEDALDDPLPAPEEPPPPTAAPGPPVDLWSELAADADEEPHESHDDLVSEVVSEDPPTFETEVIVLGDDDYGRRYLREPEGEPEREPEPEPEAEPEPEPATETEPDAAPEPEVPTQLVASVVEPEQEPEPEPEVPTQLVASLVEPESRPLVPADEPLAADVLPVPASKPQLLTDDDEPPAPVPVVGPVAMDAPAGTGPDAQPRRLRARRVRRIVRRVDPWSVFRISAAFYFCLYLVTLLAGVILWLAAERAGVIEGVEGFMKTAGGYKVFHFQGFRIFQGSVALGFILVWVGAFWNVLLVVLFNLISDITGGVRLTVIEEAGPRAASKHAPPPPMTSSPSDPVG